MPEPHEALPGRDEKMPVPARHFVTGNPMQPPYPEGLETAMFGLGCFWGGGALLLAGAGCIYHGRGLCGWHDTQPHL